MPGGRGSAVDIARAINEGGELAASLIQMSTETGEYVIHSSMKDLGEASRIIKDEYKGLFSDIWCKAQADRRVLWDY